MIGVDAGKSAWLGAFVGPAMAGIAYREWAMYKRHWRSTTALSLLQPVIFLLGLGLGLGSLVHEAAGYRYLDFVATGFVGMGTMNSAAFPAMYNTYVRREFQRSYDAILAAPVTVHEVVAAEALALAARSGLYGCAPAVAAIPFGLRPGPTVVLVPLISVLAGLGFALFGIWMSSIARTIDTPNYVSAAVLTPMFILAGTFFPIDGLPGWALVAAQVDPLYHCVELVRHATFELRPVDLSHLAALLVFVAFMWLLAASYMQRRLID
jgi:lipooligosaccharide transport system permease protein